MLFPFFVSKDVSNLKQACLTQFQNLSKTKKHLNSEVLSVSSTDERTRTRLVAHNEMTGSIYEFAISFSKEARFNFFNLLSSISANCFVSNSLT